MKAKVEVQFLGKIEPNREKEKTNFHYGMMVTDHDVTKELETEDFQLLDFWSPEDLDVKIGKKYLATIKINGEFISFVSLDKEL